MFVVLGYFSAAGAAPAPPSRSEAVYLLRSNQFSKLNSRRTAIQDAYKSRLISDEELLAAVRVFYATDPTLESSYSLWVEQMPNSYVVQLVRGIYCKKIGQERRGINFTSDTSHAQMQAMESAIILAAGDLRTSLSLDDKPLSQASCVDL